MERFTEEELQKEMNDTMSKIKEVKKNINNGIRLLLFAIARFFIEIWIVEEIWNALVAQKFGLVELTYWETLSIMFMIRIILGQFKINFSAQK